MYTAVRLRGLRWNLTTVLEDIAEDVAFCNDVTFGYIYMTDVRVGLDV